MKAYIVEVPTPVEPLGEAARDLPIGERLLKDHQREALRGLDFDPVPVPDAASVPADAAEHLVVRESLFFTPEVLRTFVQRSRKLGRRTVACLKKGLFTETTVPPTQDVRTIGESIAYGLAYVPAAAPPQDPEPVVLDPDTMTIPIPIPMHMSGGKQMATPCTTRILVQIDHWVNLLTAQWVYAMLPGARLAENPLRALLAGARSLSFNTHKLLRSSNKIGRRCDIHPTAWIEGSTIGDDVIVGANASIFSSVVGKGSVIGDNAAVGYTTIGERCWLSNAESLVRCLLFSGVQAHSGFVNSIMGRDSFIGAYAVFTDFRLDGKTITVEKDGRIVDTGHWLLGSCIGHHSYVGSGVTIAAGRKVPCGHRIAKSADHILSRFPMDEAARAYRLVRHHADMGPTVEATRAKARR